jgi:hypothetical protein
MSGNGVALLHFLRWLLPLLTVAFVALGIFSFWLFTDAGGYSIWRNRVRRRRWLRRWLRG